MTYSDIISCRTIIVLMVVLGYINQEMLRVNLNIAIGDMIEPDPNDTLRNVTPAYKGDEIRFRLTESQKHHLLFAFFWGYMMFDVIGGYFLDMMGPRKILGFSIAVSGLVTAFTPLIGVTCGYYGLLTIRAILGLTMGGIYPSALPLAFNWIAKDQKHKFLAILSCGSLGGGLSFSLFGFMVAHYGWASVFYFTSASNAFFCILWFYLIYDTPLQHPRISLQEKRRILAEVDASSGIEKNKIPWRKFFFSKVIWSLCFAYASGATMYFFTIAQLPYYVNQIHGMNIGNGGLVSSLPLICRPIFAFIFGYIADRMIRSKRINVLTVRWVFASIKLGLEPTCFILLGFFGDLLAPTIALFILAFVFGSAVHAGVNTTMLDVAPSFSGTITTISNNSDIMSCRTIIVLMVILGYINKEMVRANINIAIVDMIEPDANDTLRNITPPYKGEEIRFRLTESQKHHLLFAYFWGYMVFDIIGGYVLDIVGPRKIFGFSVAVSGLITAFTPLIGVTCGYYGLITVRVILGLTTGGVFPSALPLGFNWIAKNQKHKFLAILSVGPLGGGLCYSLFGFMVEQYGWASVFYFTSACNALFCVLWFYLIYDTPKQHPRISIQEKRRILAEVDASSVYEKNKLPWKKYLSSKVIWSLTFAFASGGVMYFFTMSQLPYYMNKIHGMDIRSGGLISGVPLICRPIFSFIFGYIADRLIKSKKMKVLTVRRIFASIKHVLEPTCFILLGFFGDSLAATIALFILASIFGSAINSGVNTTMLDVVPSFSGTITTISNSTCSIILIGISELLAYFTKTGSDFKNFRKIFFVLAAIDLFAWVLFMLFANTKTKRWNFKETKMESSIKEKEMTKLNKLFN